MLLRLYARHDPRLMHSIASLPRFIRDFKRKTRSQVFRRVAVEKNCRQKSLQANLRRCWWRRLCTLCRSLNCRPLAHQTQFKSIPSSYKRTALEPISTATTSFATSSQLISYSAAELVLFWHVIGLHNARGRRRWQFLLLWIRPSQDVVNSVRSHDSVHVRFTVWRRRRSMGKCYYCGPRGRYGPEFEQTDRLEQNKSRPTPGRGWNYGQQRNRLERSW
jgi:hypothetical protein